MTAEDFCIDDTQYLKKELRVKSYKTIIINADESQLFLYYTGVVCITPPPPPNLVYVYNNTTSLIVSDNRQNTD